MCRVLEAVVRGLMIGGGAGTSAARVCKSFQLCPDLKGLP